MNNKIKWLLKNISFIKPIAKKLVSKNQKYIYTWRIMLGKVSFKELFLNLEFLGMNILVLFVCQALSEDVFKIRCYICL